MALVLAGTFSTRRLLAQGAAILTNSGFLTYSIGPNDDGSTASAVPLGFNVNFFGTTYSSIFVNNNGNLTFLAGLPAYTPENLGQVSLPIIAPFWANVDTRGAGSGVVTYGTDLVNGFPSFGVNYVNVGYYNQETNLLNSFQVVLIDRSDTGPGNFDIEFNYNSIEWETGDASGGLDGLGGISAAAGFSNGQCSGIGTCNYLQIAGSLVPGSFLNSNSNGLIYRTLNSTVPGRLVFSVRSGTVSCSYSLTPASQNFPPAGGSGTVGVTTPSGCAWTASSDASFLTITSAASGNTTGAIQYTVEANPGGARSGTMTIAGQSFEVDQEAADSCFYEISPQALSFGSSGGNGTVAVTAPPGCVWTAVSNAGFIAITSGTSGDGSGTVGFSVAANTGTELASGTVSVAGMLLTVVEAGSMPLPAMSISPPRVFVSANTATSSFERSIAISSNSGSQGWTMLSQSFNGPAGWLTVSPTSGTAAAGQPSVVILTFNPSGLASGIYQGQITVQNSSGATVGSVPVLLEVTSGSQLVLSQLSFLFSIQQGGALPPTQTLQVLNAGQGSMNWSISAASSSAFTISAPGGVAEAGSGGNSVALGVNPTGLSPGIYQNLFQVSAPGAADGSQSVLVTLQVVPSGSAPQGQLLPGGMLFTATQGGATSPSQVLTVNNTGGGSLGFALQATTDSGGNWLSVSPVGGTAGPEPATVQVAANASGLAPGIYRGLITASFSGGATQQAEVVLVVSPASACIPAGMDMLLSSLNGGAAPAVSFPQPLVVQVVDNCGNPVNTASLAVTVDSLNIVLSLAGNGMYVGNWTPQSQEAAVAAVLTAVDPVLGTLERSYTVSTGAAPGGQVLPSVLPGGVVGAAAFPPLVPLAPGSIIAIFGSNLAAAPTSAAQLPLPASLGGVSVTVNGENAPLYYAGPGQINAQVPFDLAAGETVSLLVTANGFQAAPQNYLLAPVQPAIFTIPAGTGTEGAILDLNAENQLITPSNPAHLGDMLVIYGNGLGLTSPQMTTGQPSTAAQAVEPVTVTVGGVPVLVLYAGMTPTLAGENQINIQLTGSIPTGDSVPVVVTQNGVPSNAVSISIQ